MDRRLRTAHPRIIAIVIVFLSAVYSAICLRVLLARQEGLSTGAAVRTVLSFRELAHWGVVPVVVMALAVLLYVLIIRRVTAGPGTAAAPGAVQWRRLRLVVTIGVFPFVAFVAARLLYLLVTGGAVEESDWIAIGLGVFFGALVAGYWIIKPAPEYLYALETGDRSRMDDERAERVRGRSAVTTLSIFAVALFLGGVLYEVLVQGAWPIRSSSELGLILLIWGLASRYWNRAL